jgi:hypothetical protein
MPTVADDVDEHPIIFNEWSVRRILAGEKTQTRRICDYPLIANIGPDGEWWPVENPDDVDTPFGDEEPVDCPYGQPGDVLWVRGAFRIPEAQDGVRRPKEYAREDRPMAYPHCYYEADGSWDNSLDASSIEPGGGRKRPAIHMPREFCRLRLRVEDVRVERVQYISGADAQAEGITGDDVDKHDSRHFGPGEIYRLAFRDLWEDIHGDGAWERNDWVWVVEFSRTDQPA